jgi:hypothetical protein
MKKITLLLVTTVCLTMFGNAQVPAGTWYFGDEAGITWCTTQPNGDPTVLTNGSIQTNEGCAAISDANCNLLFYTDGITVWNANHTVMTNSMVSSPGGGLLGDPSSTQSAFIIQKPGSSLEYYLFAVDANIGVNGLTYSKIDMSLNSGLGDIVLTEKNVFLTTPCTEKINGTRHSNGVDYWVVSHAWGSNSFLAYLVTSFGVNTTPVVSNIGLVHSGASSNSRGYLKFSQSGDKLAVAIEGSDTYQLFDFNATTGVVSNVLTLTGTSYEDCYGVEFSHNGQFLYGSERWGNDVRQWDISLSTASAIQASETIIGILGSSNGGALQLGPDNKIYLARNNTSFLGRINNPTAAGTSCNYVDQAINLGSSDSNEGLPNIGISNQNFMNILAATINVQNADCAANSTGSAEVIVNGGVSPFFYLWSTGDTLQTIQNLSTGMYSVTITDSDTSTYITNCTITSPNPITSTFNVYHVDTVVSAFGTINLTVSGGTPPYTYLWSNGATGNYIDNLNAGLYTCTITDMNNCTAIENNFIGYYSPAQAPVIDHYITDGMCYNSCDGAIDISIVSGISPFTYVWSNGANTEDISNLCNGTYELTVYDANTPAPLGTNPWNYVSTTYIHTVNIPQNVLSLDGMPIENGDFLGAFYSDNGLYKCAGYAEYLGSSFNLTVYGDNPGTPIKDGFANNELLNWRIWDASNGWQYILMAGYDPVYPDADQFQNGGSSGILMGMASSGSAISVSSSVSLTVSSPFPIVDNPLISNYGGFNTSSTTSNDGWINIAPTEGTPPYSFQWTNGATTEDINNLTAGTYGLTITDTNGCVAAFSYSLTAPFGALSVTGSTNHESCVGTCDGVIEITVTGGAPPYSYLWSNGATSEVINNLCPGTYDLTISDNSSQNSSTMPWSYTITPSNHTVLIIPACLDSANIQVGDYLGAFYLVNGTYECGGYALITSTSSPTAVSAWGDDTGTTIKDGFDIGEDFTWKVWRSNTGNIENLAASYEPFPFPNQGTYVTNGMSQVSDFDVSIFEVYASFTIQPATPLSILSSITNVDPVPGSNGAINISVNGGQSPYSYLWSNGETTASISNLDVGSYYLTVTDANNCLLTDSFTLSLTAPYLTFDLMATDVLCYNGATGSTWITNIDGVSPFTYLWSNGETTDSITNLAAGVYSVTATGANLDQYSNSIEVYQPTEIMVDIVVTNYDLATSTGGAIDVTVTGGVSPYTYLWNNGSTLEDLSNCAYGAYSLTITDMAGCSVTGNAFVDYSVLPPWSMNLSGNSHTISIPATANLEINGISISQNDFIGVFYNDNGTLYCGGYIIWQAATSTLYAYADNVSTTTKDGFATGDEFHWKFWDASTSTEYAAVATYNTTYPNQEYFAPSGSSAVDSVQTISLSGTVSLTTKAALPLGMMLLYQTTINGHTAVNKCPIVDGDFFIEGIQAGDYMLYAIPKPNQNFGIPAYYVDKLDWQDANWIQVTNHTTAIDLVLDPVLPYNTGTASIEGSIMVGDDSSYNPDVFGDEWFPSTKNNGDPARNIPILLYDNQMNPMDFRLTDEQGQFNFTQMEYGSYYVKVEKAGLQSDALQVTLDASNPLASDISFTLNQGQVISVEENYSLSEIKVYPNPVESELAIVLPGGSKNVSIELFSIRGRKIDLKGLENFQGPSSQKYNLDISSIQSGVYMLKITVNDTIFVEKLTKL